MALAIESGFPVSTYTAVGATSFTRTITTAGPSLIVVCFQANGDSNNFPLTSIAGSTLGALTKITGASGNRSFGSVGGEWWSKISAGALTSEVITVTSPLACRTADLVVYSITGYGASPIGATANAGASSLLSLTVNAQAVNSLVLVQVCEFGSATALTANSNNSPFDEHQENLGDVDAHGTGHAVTSSTGNIAVGATNTPSSAYATAVEILAALLTGPGFDSTGFDGTVFYTGATGTQFTQSLAGTLTSSGSLSKRTARALSGTATSTGLLAKQTQRALTATLATGGAIVKRAQKVLAGALSSSGALATIKAALVSLAGTLTAAGTLSKFTQKSFAGTLSSAGALVKQTQKSFAGTAASAGALVKRTSRALTAALTSSATLVGVKAALKSLAGTLTSSGTLVRLPNKALAGTVASTGAIVKKTAKGIAGVLTPVGTLSKQIRRGLSATLSFIGTFVGSSSAQPVFGAPLSGRQDAPGLTGKQDAAAVTGKQDQDALKGNVS